jgi:Flp pilus assembly protein TadD
MHESAQTKVVELIQTGRHNQALEVLEAHLQSEPNDWYAFYMSGVANRFLGNLDEAVSLLKQAVALSPNQAPVFLALGIGQQVGGNLEEAVASLTRAKELKPELIEAYNSLGLTFKKMRRYKDALESYERGSEMVMELVSLEVHKDAALCYRDEVIDGETVRTVLPYVLLKTLELLKSNPVYAILRNNAGVCLAELGDTEGARDLYKEAIDCTPEGYHYPDPFTNLERLANSR